MALRRLERRFATGAVLGALFALGATALATGARAERLALADGSWIETRGPVRIERGRVIFRSPEGNLRSLPLAELALAGPTAAPPPRGAPLREYPSDAPIFFAPPPSPPPRRWPRRPDSPGIPPRCWLANARPGDPPELLCGEEPGGASPLPAPAPGESAGDGQRSSPSSGS